MVLGVVLIGAGCQKNGRPEAPSGPPPANDPSTEAPAEKAGKTAPDHEAIPEATPDQEAARAPKPAPETPPGQEAVPDHTQAASEEGMARPISCSANTDCGEYLLPKCVKGGCSPPCGRVYRTEPAALNRRQASKFIAALEQREKKSCNIVCIMCAGVAPTPPDLSKFSAVCRDGKCILKGP
jgi:hypothetical protein